MNIFTTMITPYTADGKVDISTAEKYVDWYFENGIDGIFSVCLSSEIFQLSLEERVKLNSAVYKRAKELEKIHNRTFKVISSGHVSESIEDQAKELNAIYESGTDAVIFITNRLDLNNEGDDVFIKNAEKLISLLPSEAKLGLYECPYPYKRLVTPKILNWCLETGRFYYMKDTSCDVAMIKERIKLLKGTQFELMNANCQTLLETMRLGAGYCGIMCNFHPKLYALLKEICISEPEKADILQALTGSLGFTESGLPYPLTAKYHMGLCGIPTENVARNKDGALLTDYVKGSVEQMKRLTDYAEELLAK